MAIETSIDALTTQTFGLLEACVAIKTGVAAQISNAVSESTNAALIPLVTMATNLIDTQTLLVTYIAKK